MVKYLLENGASSTQFMKNKEGLTPLHIAVASENKKVVSLRLTGLSAKKRLSAK